MRCPLSLYREKTDIPKLWPEDVIYCKGLIWDIEDPDTEELIPLMRDHFHLRKLTENHPAFEGGRGKGLFSTSVIHINAILGEYTGLVRDKGNGAVDARYALGKGKRKTIDAKFAGNEVLYR